MHLELKTELLPSLPVFWQNAYERLGSVALVLKLGHPWESTVELIEMQTPGLPLFPPTTIWFSRLLLREKEGVDTFWHMWSVGHSLWNTEVIKSAGFSDSLHGCTPFEVLPNL